MIDVNKNLRDPNILNCNSLSDVTSLLHKSNGLFRRASTFTTMMEKIEELVQTETEIDHSFLYELFQDDDTETHTPIDSCANYWHTFSIVEQYYNNLFTNSNGDFMLDKTVGVWDEMTILDYALIHLLFTVDVSTPQFKIYCKKIKESVESYSQYLYALFDLCSPSESAREEANALAQFITRHFADFATSAYNYDYLFKEVLNSYDFGYFTQEEKNEMLTIVGVIWDNISHRESKHNIFYEMIKRYSRYVVRENIDNIVLKYSNLLNIPYDYMNLHAIDFLSYTTTIFHTLDARNYKNARDKYIDSLRSIISAMIEESTVLTFENACPYISSFFNDLKQTMGRGYCAFLGDMTAYVEQYWNTLESTRSMDYYDICEIAFEAPTKISTINSELHETANVRKTNPTMQKAQSNIYKAYKSYKNKESEVDGQITNAINTMRNAYNNDIRTEIIEGRKFSAIGLLKKLLGTVAVFSYSKIAGVILLVVQFATRKNTKESEKKKILSELENELEIINEKIEDARSDNDREAKYALMRTKAELEDAIRRIRYNIKAKPSSTHIEVKGGKY